MLQLYSLKCVSCALLLISQDLRQRTVASMIDMKLNQHMWFLHLSIALTTKVETIWRAPTCAKTSPAYTISVLTCLETQRFGDSTSDLSQMTQDVATLFDDCRIETSRQGGVNHLVSVDFFVNSSCIAGFLWTGCT